ncbi:hypothetical protein B7R23_05155 [Subtercola boreus]|nr:hypothetical protein B7R24_05210 [Subtercola boreus]RFA22265.1 hypothetical protein B7R23_05155 [Subtercola boreus]
MFPGRQGIIFYEIVREGTFGSATRDQITYQYDLNGDNVWRKPDFFRVAGPDTFSFLTGKDLVEGTVNVVRLRAVATIKGRVYASVPSAPIGTYVFGEIDRNYTLKTVVAADTVTVSWDITAALHGQRATIEFSDDSDFQYVGPVGSVTIRPGFSQTVTPKLDVIGENLDFDMVTYQTTVTTGPAGTGAAFTQTPKPTIVGTPQVGSVLTAQTGTWKPLPVTFSYQWSRNGVPLAGATRSQYTPAAADAGAALSVTVTGRTPSGSSASLESTPTAAIAARVISGVGYATNGTPSVGNTLSADVANVTPLGATFTFQWLSDGAPIPGQTRSSYRIVQADLGHYLSVSITARKTGYPSTTLTTEPYPVTAG